MRMHFRFPAPTARRIPARGNAPGVVPRLAIRPEGAKDPCAPSGRAKFRLALATQGVALG
jgi:hypothetical protein